jgi:gamma-glutamyl:cysteine ligase YbdK (ATP-grasp superfamily)
MGEEIGTLHFTPRDFMEYRARLTHETEVLAECLNGPGFAGNTPTGGYEIEACLIDSGGRPSPVNTSLLERLHSPFVVSELARFDVEINSPPRELCANVLACMHEDLRMLCAQCNRVARDFDTELLLVGILPTLTDADLTLERMSPQRRYRALNDQVLRVRHGLPITLDIQGREHLHTRHADVMLEAAATSFQMHLRVAPEAAARMYNTAIILSAPMVALAANSPYLFGRDLWDETRIPLFEQAVDLLGDGTAPRVTLGDGYVSHSLIECFRENLERHVVLLPIVKDEPVEQFTHLRLHNGTIWRWNRPLIGFDSDGRPHLRIEHRVTPAGPSLTDQIANAAMFFGLMQHFGKVETPPESQLPFADARANFYAAARDGLRAELTWLNGRRLSARELLHDVLLPAARAGLEALELAPEDRTQYLGVIAGRLRTGQNGTQWQRAYVERHGTDMAALTCRYREHQRTDRPVHEWPLGC